ncbi:MAG: D-alanyl-D-alanine carboxypeptidase [Mariprofundaceae bacterium]|nr:D-alanyl-D-alanine carboxypeptidase [Mariprofundaceae bacterium]
MVMKAKFQRIIFLIMMFIPLTASAVNWPQSPAIEAKSWALMDARSGQVVSSHNENVELAPASLTKIMTLYLAFQDIKLGRLDPGEQIPVSKKAWKIGGSTMFLEPRMKPTIEQVLHGISTLSGNDACVAIAEHISGSEEAFVTRMNETAKRLGLTHTHFVNATGFPVEGHYSSALDMVRLGAALWRDFPEQYALVSEKSYTFDGRTQWNRNRMLWSMPESDGIKTGHTEEAGYCLVASAERNNTRLISAVFGAESDKARQQQSRTLLLHGFRNFITLRPAERDIRRQAEVFEGTSESVWLKPSSPIWVTMPKGNETMLSFRLRYESPLKAPIKQGDLIGTIEAVVRDGGNEQILTAVSMEASESVEQASWVGRQWDRLRLWWRSSEEASTGG